MHLLSIAGQRDQIESLIEMRRIEAAGLINLRTAHADEGGCFPHRLDHEINRAGDDPAWFKDPRAGLAEDARTTSLSELRPAERMLLQADPA